jgi:ATP/ADP translocase
MSLSDVCLTAALCVQVAHLPERLVFYTSVLPLLAYYALFATVLYPIAGSLHPMELMNSLMSSVPTGTQCAYQT